MKIEIEKPINFSPSIITIVVALGIGGLVLISSGLCAGLFAFWFVGGNVQVLVDLLNPLFLPKDTELYVQAALEHFQQDIPDAQIVSVAVRDIDDQRFIFSIRYEQPHRLSFPTARRYYAVKRSDKSATPEDTSRWWPRGLK